MVERHFKYMRQDFGPMPVALEHLEITIEFFEDRVEAGNRLEMIARQAIEQLELDANQLDVLAVTWCEPDTEDRYRPGASLAYRYSADNNQLVVDLPSRVEPNQRFAIRTVTRCHPSEHILEGIYRDTTPPGAPQQYMSQCQQWGFQRIMPIFDDCRAKCTMTTTLEGDIRYTHLISNGNVDRRTNPDGKPVPKPGDPSRQTITYHNPVPMAPYLFIACAGTWDALVDRVTYPSGRTVQLEYLVPPGKAEQARGPMEILKDSIRWIAQAQDYEYQGDVYRTICMNKSNFGGMENVGNTTIVTDAALIDEHTLDQQILYSHAVIVHEFEHNQCGSETTMDTPFDVWLNEAYTVDVERQFMADRFDPTFIRLQQVDSIRNPLLGPMAIEDGGHAGRIVREGFNDPDELIDGVTYVKAAEVIRMLRLIVGPDAFRAGKQLYFSRFRNGNASTDQFFQCFEETSARSLTEFKKNWLYRIGYPAVTASVSYDAAEKQFTIHFRQECRGLPSSFHIPVELALVGRDGADPAPARTVFEITEPEARCAFTDIQEAPWFVSINRSASFYGSFRRQTVDRSELVAQAKRDPDPFNRVEAFRQLTDRERIALLHQPEAEVGTEWLDLYREFIADPDLPHGLHGYFLRIEEQPLDRSFCTWYPELVVARERLMAAVNQRYRRELLERFRALPAAQATDSPGQGIEARFLGSILLGLITVDDSPDSHALILEQIETAGTANDCFVALAALNRSCAPQRHEVLAEAYRNRRNHLSGYANYLKIIGGGTQPDVFQMIQAEKQRSGFDIRHPTLSRSLFVSLALNTKMIWTDPGIRWVGDIVMELAPVNSTIASRVLNTFQHVDKLKPVLQEPVTKVLETITQTVDKKVSPTIAGQARSYLEAALATAPTP